MVNLKYTDEETFITENVEFRDEHYGLAKKLHENYENDPLSICTPLIVRKDRESLVFAVNFGNRDIDRLAWERGDSLYRVIIEKIK